MDFGPLALWQTMTPIAKGVVIALVILSIWSLYVAIERIIFFRKAKQQSLAFAKIATQMIGQDRIQELLDTSRKNHTASHLARVTRAALIEFQLDTTTNRRSGNEVVESAKRAIERESLVTFADFRKGVPGLATIATTAPFIGLFGTVIGIINAFRGMAMTGSGGIGAVSAGIAEALVTTALGLFVAIPAAWMFNYFTNTLERIQIEMTNSSSELIDFFIKKGSSNVNGSR